jgi:hypothetical protein
MAKPLILHFPEDLHIGLEFRTAILSAPTEGPFGHPSILLTL